MCDKSKKLGLFIRVPKNASTSMLNAFNNADYTRKAKSLKDLNGILNKCNEGILYSKTGFKSRLIHQHSQYIDINNIFSFGFVRNPYSRVVSSFKLHSNSSVVEQWRTIKKNNFKEYLCWLQNKNLNPENMFDSPEILMACHQYPFLIDDKNEVSVDFIGRVENIQSDIDSIIKTLSLEKIIIPHLNVTNTKNYVEYYDDECLKIVEKIYKKDIEFFNYKFGE